MRDLQGAPLGPSSTHLSTSPGDAHHFPLLMSGGAFFVSIGSSAKWYSHNLSLDPFSFIAILFCVWYKNHKELVPLAYPSFHCLHISYKLSKTGLLHLYQSNSLGLGLACSAVESCPIHYTMLNSTPDLYQVDVNSNPLPHCDNQKCLYTLLNIPSRGKIAPDWNHCSVGS